MQTINYLKKRPWKKSLCSFNSQIYFVLLYGKFSVLSTENDISLYHLSVMCESAIEIVLIKK